MFGALCVINCYFQCVYRILCLFCIYLYCWGPHNLTSLIQPIDENWYLANIYIEIYTYIQMCKVYLFIRLVHCSKSHPHPLKLLFASVRTNMFVACMLRSPDLGFVNMFASMFAKMCSQTCARKHFRKHVRNKYKKYKISKISKIYKIYKMYQIRIMEIWFIIKYTFNAFEYVRTFRKQKK